MASVDGAALVVTCLRAAGARRIFVAAGHGLDELVDALVAERVDLVAVADDELASVLADADGALAVAPALGPGVALLSGRRLRLTSDPGAVVDPIDLVVEDVPAAIAGWSLGRARSAVEYALPSGLDAPVDSSLRPLVVQRDDRLLRLSPGLAGLRIVLLVGTGVVRDGAATDVAGGAERTGASIVATPGAVGVVPASHPSWRGVVGVQVDDAIGTGLDEAELVIAVGVDDEEPGAMVPDAAQLIDLEPWHLAFLGLDWPAPTGTSDATGGADRRFVDELAALLAAHRADDSLPLHPVRAAIDVLDAVPADARVAVDAGPVGLWFVRGVLPVAAGRAVVPTRVVEGFAAAAAIVGALDGTRVVGLTTPGDPVTPRLLGLASELSLPVVVEQWGDDVAMGDASRHRAELVGALTDGGVHLQGVAVDLAAAAELVELAGPVMLWTADRPEPA